MTNKTKESALKAARKALGEAATEGVDFNLRNTGAGWAFEPIPAANEAAVQAKAKRAPKPASAPQVGRPKHPNKSAGAKSAHARRKAKSTNDADTKTAQFIDMLKAPGGATSKELEAAMGWKSHSVRGLIGTLKQRGVNVESKKLKGEPTFYRIVPAKPAPISEIGDVI